MERRPLDFRSVLLHHLDYTFEKEAWQPSLAMAVDGVTHAEAAWKVDVRALHRSATCAHYTAGTAIHPVDAVSPRLL